VSLLLYKAIRLLRKRKGRADLALPFMGAACIAPSFEWNARLIWAAVAFRNATGAAFRAA